MNIERSNTKAWYQKHIIEMLNGKMLKYLVGRWHYNCCGDVTIFNEYESMFLHFHFAWCVEWPTYYCQCYA
jgi:hypothetical protein